MISLKENSGPAPVDPAARISRRSFLSGTAAFLALGLCPQSRLLAEEEPREAMFYTTLNDGRIRCGLCPHGCTIRDGRRGICRVRENRGGRLYSLVYGRACSMHADPIEKKPFFHVLPGTIALSLSTVGCNMKCKFCQNWQISQSRPDEVRVGYTSPTDVVEKALSLKIPSIAYTYGEPVVFYEYMLDISREAKENSIRNLVVTNGYYTLPALRELCSVADAIKIDLKAFEESYYRDVCGASLGPVLDSLKEIKGRGIWLEIVYLVVPSLNDDPEVIGNMSKWIVSNLGPDVPVHFSRFQPQYRLSNLPPTPVESLEKAWETCTGEGVRYCYIGNLSGHRTENTFCHNCGRMIIERRGYAVRSIEMISGSCRFCGERIPGVWV